MAHLILATLYVLAGFYGGYQLGIHSPLRAPMSSASLVGILFTLSGFAIALYVWHQIKHEGDAP
jgi:hypothetical protein